MVGRRSFRSRGPTSRRRNRARQPSASLPRRIWLVAHPLGAPRPCESTAAAPRRPTPLKPFRACRDKVLSRPPKAALGQLELTLLGSAQAHPKASCVSLNSPCGGSSFRLTGGRSPRAWPRWVGWPKRTRASSQTAGGSLVSCAPWTPARARCGLPPREDEDGEAAFVPQPPAQLPSARVGAMLRRAALATWLAGLPDAQVSWSRRASARNRGVLAHGRARPSVPAPAEGCRPQLQSSEQDTDRPREAFFGAEGGTTGAGAAPRAAGRAAPPPP